MSCWQEVWGLKILEKKMKYLKRDTTEGHACLANVKRVKIRPQSHRGSRGLQKESILYSENLQTAKLSKSV